MAAASFAIDDGTKGRERLSASPIEVVGQWLKNLTDPDVIHSIVAPDATYISLNTENAELNKIMPWAGTSFGPQAFLKNLSVTTMFAADKNVAVFGNFRYKSKSLGKVVASPFEDTYATASSFRKDGSWTIQTEPDAEPFQV